MNTNNIIKYKLDDLKIFIIRGWTFIGLELNNINNKELYRVSHIFTSKETAQQNLDDDMFLRILPVKMLRE